MKRMKKLKNVLAGIVLCVTMLLSAPVVYANQDVDKALNPNDVTELVKIGKPTAVTLKKELIIEVIEDTDWYGNPMLIYVVYDGAPTKYYTGGE